MPEHPPFGGPAAAVAAGVHELADDADAVLLLAGDQPFVADAVPLLLGASRARATVMALGRWMPRSAAASHLLVRRVALVMAIDAVGLEDRSRRPMRRLLEPLRLVDVAVPERATMDVDTWADARAVGATEGGGR